VRAASDAYGGALVQPAAAQRRWLDPASAFLTADVLADDAARVPGFGPRSVLDLPFAVAVKTGTSTDYRNSWCVGFTRDHVVGVWVGNFDASPIHGLAGVTGAGPVFRAAMLRLRDHGTRPWEPTVPPGWKRSAVCALSGDAPSSACAATVLEWFAPGAAARRPTCTFHRREGSRVVVDWPAEYRDWARDSGLDGKGDSDIRVAAASPARILSPLDGSVYFRDPRLSASAIRFTAEGAEARDRWFLDGLPVPASAAAGAPLWSPQPGEHHLQLRRGTAMAEVRFTVR
jgi:penicillin-binding protein 1C